MLNKLGLFAFLAILILGVACTISAPGSSGSASTPQNNNDNSSDDQSDDDSQNNVQSVPSAGYYTETIEYGSPTTDEEISDFGKALGACENSLSSLVNQLSAVSNWYNVGEEGRILEICSLNDQTMIALCEEPECSTYFKVVSGCLVQETSDECNGQDSDSGDDEDQQPDSEEMNDDSESPCQAGEYLYTDYNDGMQDNSICVSVETSLNFQCTQNATNSWTTEGTVITTHTAMGSMTMVNTFGFCGTPGETLEISEGDQQVIEQTYAQTLMQATRDVEDMGYIRF